MPKAKVKSKISHEKGGMCKLFMGVTLLVIGGVFLLIQMGILAYAVWSWLWPVLLVIWGLKLIVISQMEPGKRR